ncbi:MAG: hypothetical protein HKN32_06705, partial [Flavobacteriales bacterium]|nr:hypothetical protein [Flavobacteriales bacterium]
MKYLSMIVGVFFGLTCTAQLEVTNLNLAPEANNVLRYDLTFSTSAESYAYVDYYRMVTNDDGAVIDSIVTHTPLQGPTSDHSFKIWGITPDTDYSYQVFAYNVEECVDNGIQTFVTDTLPTTVATMDSVYMAEGADLDGFYLTNTVGVPDKNLQIFDREGNVVWYEWHSLAPEQGNIAQCQMFNQTAGNNILLLECHELTEINLKGDVLNYIDLNGTPADTLFFHHDAIINEAGNFVVIAAANKVFPSGDSTITVIQESLLEIDMDGNIVWEWHSLDHFDAYQATSSGGFFIPIMGADAINWMHCNSVYQDVDGHYIVSFKNWDQGLKIHSSTGEIIWQLGGEDGDINFALGDSFGDQHDINRTNVGTYILFDNTGLDSISRMLEFSIDFYDLPVAINEWEWELPQDNHSHILGSAKRLSNQNRVCVSGVTGSIFEVSAGGEVQWHHRQNYWAYRTFFVDQLFDNSIDDIALGANPVLMCVDEESVALNAEPAGGCWSGSGVIAAVFDPDEAG